MLKTLLPTLSTFLLGTLVYGQAGTLDPSFGAGGFVETIVSTTGSRSSAVAVQPDGRILLAGRKTVTGGADGAIVRYLSTGAVDLSFALNGYLFTPNGGTLNWVDLLVLQDGRILAAGVADASHDHLLAQWNSDGTPDLTFGTNGLASLTHAPAAITLDANGNILVVGNTATEHVISRYLADGSPDTGFGTNGSTVNGLGSDLAVGTSLVVQSDDHLLVAGSSTLADEENVTMTRYTPTGAIDAAWGIGGTVTTECGSSTETGEGIALQADGKIVVGVDYETGFVVLRHLSDGTLDPAFGVDGQVYTFVGANQSYVKDIIVQPDGALLVGGRAFQNAGWAFAAVRYLGDGSLDPTFGNAGIALSSTFGQSYWPEDMALQPDGRLILAGWRQFSTDRFCMIRYFTDLTTAVPRAQTSPDGTRLWPNPSTDRVSLSVPAGVSRPINVDVFDIRGVLVKRKLTVAAIAGGSPAITIDLIGLAPGCYTVAWSDGERSGRGHVLRQ
jgi:uncharacterized delta-60 repeat protein